MDGTLRRGRLTAFVDRHLVAWEGAMGVLALGYLAVSFLVDDGAGVYPALIGGLAAVFIAEFLARFLDAPSRRAYLRNHWLDLVSSLPFIGGLRALRLLRLLRLGAGLKVLSAAEHMGEVRGGDRESLWFVVPTLLFTWFAAGAAYWVAEHGVNPSLHTFGDALYWAFITATTLGYGSHPPATSAGHLLAGLVVFIGVGLVGFSSARLTQLWLRDESRHHPRLMLDKMNRMEKDMAAIKEMLAARQRSEDEADGVSPARSEPRRAAPPGRAAAGARRPRR